MKCKTVIILLYWTLEVTISLPLVMGLFFYVGNNGSKKYMQHTAGMYTDRPQEWFIPA
jgi:hypothetical protein